MNKKGQINYLMVGIFAFWISLSGILTLYNNYSDFPEIKGVGDNNNFNVSTLISDPYVLAETQEGFFGSIVVFLRVMFDFIITFLGLVTIWFPMFDSIIATFVIGVFLLIAKVATWWGLFRFYTGS